MPKVVTTRSVSEAELARLLEPGTALVAEERLGPGTFGLGSGPFSRWERRVEVLPSSQGAARAGGGRVVQQTVEFQLAIPGWGWLFAPLVRFAIRHPRPDPPWWLPPDRFDERATRVLALLGVVSVFVGYLEVLLSQTNTYIKKEFGIGAGSMGVALAVVRVGALGALALAYAADKRGRRFVLAWSLAGSIAFTAFGALAPSLPVLVVTQALARALAVGAAIVVAVMAAEEVPAGSRAYAVSVLTMAGGLGAGGVVAFLGIADLSPGAWRSFFAFPLVVLPIAWRVTRALPETLRFGAAERAASEPRRTDGQPSGATGARRSLYRRRFALVGIATLLFAVFFTPASNYANDFLRTEQGFQGWKIALFTVVTDLPGGLAIVIGGRLADTRGRRVVAILGVLGGVGFTVLMFLASGWSLWVWSTLGTAVGAAAVPALAVYGPELFPTESRGLANGAVNLLGVAGGVTGLLVAGRLADHFGRYGPAMALLALAPVAVLLLVFAAFPETARLSLEEINPGEAEPG